MNSVFIMYVWHTQSNSYLRHDYANERTSHPCRINCLRNMHANSRYMFSCVCIHDVVSAVDIHVCFLLYEVYMILWLVHVTVSNTSQQYDPLYMYWPLQKSTFNIIHAVLVLWQLVLGTSKIPLKRTWDDGHHSLTGWIIWNN